MKSIPIVSVSKEDYNDSQLSIISATDMTKLFCYGD